MANIVSARRDGKWMHYSLQLPVDAAAISILDAVLAAFKTNPEMRADLLRLNRACCEPQKLLALQGAPQPIALAR